MHCISEPVLCEAGGYGKAGKADDGRMACLLPPSSLFNENYTS